MAIYSFNVSLVKRSRGQNAIEAASYNSRSKLTLERYDKATGFTSKFTFDYSKKGGLAYSKIYAPENSPEWVYEREKLWNKAEFAESRVNAQTARKFMIALPIELTEEQNVLLLEEFVLHLVEMGMVVDANIHNDHQNNPHAHLMATLRPLVLDRYGEMVLSKVKCREWGKRAVLKYQRELWAQVVNKHLALHRFDARITDKSYKDLGLDLIPGVHEGPARNIKNAELVELNRSIAKENARRVQENPSLIIDKLVINKPVFTKEELAVELEKVLYAGVEFKNEIRDNGLEIIEDNGVKDNAGDACVGTSDDVISDAHMEALEERANQILAKKVGVIKAQEQAAIEAFHLEMTKQYMELYNQLLCSPELSLVVEEDLKGRELYTSSKRLELEERYVETVSQMHLARNHGLGLEDADLDELSFGESVAKTARALAAHVASTEVMKKFTQSLKDATGIEFKIWGEAPSLSLEQREAVLSILNGSDISILEGIPGSGKTTAMGEMVRQYKKAGYRVIGVAPSSAAALQLQKATGIEAKNATLWRKEWLLAGKKEFELVLRADYFKEERYIDNDSRLTNKHVMIIDEASMGELSQMDYLLGEAKKVGAKVILVLDDNQLSAVGYGGASKKAINICGSNKLYESRRQLNPDHQRATKLLGEFRVREALDIYHEAGNIIIDENRGVSRERLVSDYIDEYLKKIGELRKDNLASIRSMVICTYTNVESLRLNVQVRAQLKEAGVIKGKEYEVLVGDKKLLLARGEQIVFSRNLNRTGRSGIYNGEVGTVLKVLEPDKFGHAKIAILVNKANGSKEGIVLDTKSFNLRSGNLLDYGYAVTGYKLQGSTVDKAFVLHEKQMGYEAFNVAMTRHREDVILYVNKEDLHDVMYESLDIDSKKAQMHYEMRGESYDIALSGLVKLTHKRVNNSFASDYFDMGLTLEDKHLKEYIANNAKTTKLIQSISNWQQKEFRIKGYKPNLWDHELWDAFREAKEFRDEGAAYIKANYGSFKDRLIQLNMNYGTILKHAHMHELLQDKGGDKKEEKNDQYLVEEKQTRFYIDNKNYEALIRALAENDGVKAKAIYGELNTEIASIYSRIQDAHEKIQEISEHKSELETAILAEENFREVLMPAYLRSIYRKAKHDAVDDGTSERHHGHDILAKYEELCKEHGGKEAAKMVGRNPSILGSLEGIGIGVYLSITNKRKDAVANAENLERQLMAYNRSREMEQQYREDIASEEFGAKIMRLQSEIESLKEQLPMSIDSKFLDEVGLSLATCKVKSKEGGIDLSSVRDSELFAAVDLKNIQGKGEFAEITVTNDAYLRQQMKSLERSEIANQAQNQELRQELRQELKQKLRQPRERYKKPSLDFAEVRGALNSMNVEGLFRQYAPYINSDGKIQKRKGSISCGSINMSLKDGLWYRFSDGRGGDIFKFIEEATGASKYDSLKIVAGAVGIEPKNNSWEWTKHLDTQKSIINKIDNNDNAIVNAPKDEWVAYDKVPLDAPGFDPIKDLSWLQQRDMRFVASYEYRNKYGQLLGYGLRIEDVKTGQKSVMPLTYAKNEVQGKSRWQLVGFSDSGYKPIYGIEKLAQHQDRPVLIVEGEKTADVAQELLPDYTVISWMGGAKSIDRVNWRALKDVPVVIWPDNDQPGIEAALGIGKNIDYHNGFVGFVNIVDVKGLSLPEKWDLADELPGYLSDRDKLSEIVKDVDYRNSLNAKQNIGNLEFGIKDEMIISGLELLVGRGKIEADEYVSKEMYHESLMLIANNSKLELGKLEGQEFVEVIRYVQDEYRNMQSLQAHDRVHNKEEDLASGLARDAKIMYQLKLGVKKLSKVFVEEIHSAAKEEAGKMKHFTKGDREFAGSNMYKEITSIKWRQNIEKENEQKVKEKSLCFKSKSIDEFLDGNSTLNNKFDILESYKNLSHIRKYGLEEDNIIKSFKKDQKMGIDHLARVSKEVEEARDFIQDEKGRGMAIIDEIQSFGGKINQGKIIRAVSGKSEEEKVEHLLQMRDEAYVDHNLLKFKNEKMQVKTPQEAMKLLDKEQSFWVGLGLELNSKKVIEDKEWLGKNIQQAKFDQKHNSLDQLYQVARYAFKNKIIDEEHLVKELTADKKLTEIHDHLTKTCYDHNCKILTKHCNEIAKGAIIEHDGHKFDDVHEYLSHWKTNVDHKLIPIKQMNVEIRKLEKALEHDYGGPGL